MVQSLIRVFRRHEKERSTHTKESAIPNVDSTESLLEAGDNTHEEQPPKPFSTKSKFFRILGYDKVNGLSEETKVYLRGVLTRTLLTGIVLAIAVYLVC